jgi:hypothetical protein
LTLLVESSEERSLFFVLPNERHADRFDVLMHFHDGQVTTETRRPPAASEPGEQKRVAGVVA